MWPSTIALVPVIQPAQKDIENIFNKFIGINGLGVKMTLNKPNINLTPSK